MMSMPWQHLHKSRKKWDPPETSNQKSPSFLAAHRQKIQKIGWTSLCIYIFCHHLIHLASIRSTGTHTKHHAKCYSNKRKRLSLQQLVTKRFLHVLPRSIHLISFPSMSGWNPTAYHFLIVLETCVFLSKPHSTVVADTAFYWHFSKLIFISISASCTCTYLLTHGPYPSC